MATLTAENVDRIFRDCVNNASSQEGDIVAVHGIVQVFAFNRGRLAAHTPEIKALLAELPPEFHADKGGGWTFLNACADRAGHQWGEHRDVEHLFALGLAIGCVIYVLPRDIWDALPGGMPYVAVNV